MKSSIPQLIRARRQARRLTQAEIARWAGMRQGDLSRFESGRHDPRLSTLLKLATALDMQLILVPKEHSPLMIAGTADEASAEQTPLERYAIEDDDG